MKNSSTELFVSVTVTWHHCSRGEYEYYSHLPYGNKPSNCQYNDNLQKMT